MTARNENEEQALLAWFHSDTERDEGVVINEIAERYQLEASRIREMINETIEGT